MQNDNTARRQPDLDLIMLMPAIARRLLGAPNKQSTATQWCSGPERRTRDRPSPGRLARSRERPERRRARLLQRQGVTDPWSWLRRQGFSNGQAHAAAPEPIAVADDDPDASSAAPVEPGLYRLTELIEAIGSEHPVFIVGDERAVETSATYNVIAKCCPGEWCDEYSDTLRGADVVVILPTAMAVAHSLAGKAARIRLLNLPDLPSWLRTAAAPRTSMPWPRVRPTSRTPGRQTTMRPRRP